MVDGSSLCETLSWESAINFLKKPIESSGDVEIESCLLFLSRILKQMDFLNKEELIFCWMCSMILRLASADKDLNDPKENFPFMREDLWDFFCFVISRLSIKRIHTKELLFSGASGNQSPSVFIQTKISVMKVFRDSIRKTIDILNNGGTVCIIHKIQSCFDSISQGIPELLYEPFLKTLETLEVCVDLHKIISRIKTEHKEDSLSLLKVALNVCEITVKSSNLKKSFLSVCRSIYGIYFALIDTYVYIGAEAGEDLRHFVEGFLRCGMLSQNNLRELSSIMCSLLKKKEGEISSHYCSFISLFSENYDNFLRKYIFLNMLLSVLLSEIKMKESLFKPFVIFNTMAYIFGDLLIKLHLEMIKFLEEHRETLVEKIIIEKAIRCAYEVLMDCMDFLRRTIASSSEDIKCRIVEKLPLLIEFFEATIRYDSQLTDSKIFDRILLNLSGIDQTLVYTSIARILDAVIDSELSSPQNNSEMVSCVFGYYIKSRMLKDFLILFIEKNFDTKSCEKLLLLSDIFFILEKNLALAQPANIAEGLEFLVSSLKKSDTQSRKRKLSTSISVKEVLCIALIESFFRSGVIIPNLKNVVTLLIDYASGYIRNLGDDSKINFINCTQDLITESILKLLLAISQTQPLTWLDLASIELIDSCLALNTIKCKYISNEILLVHLDHTVSVGQLKEAKDLSNERLKTALKEIASLYKHGSSPWDGNIFTLSEANLHVGMWISFLNHIPGIEIYGGSKCIETISTLITYILLHPSLMDCSLSSTRIFAFQKMQFYPRILKSYFNNVISEISKIPAFSSLRYNTLQELLDYIQIHTKNIISERDIKSSDNLLGLLIDEVSIISIAAKICGKSAIRSLLLYMSVLDICVLSGTHCLDLKLAKKIHILNKECSANKISLGREIHILESTLILRALSACQSNDESCFLLEKLEYNYDKVFSAQEISPNFGNMLRELLTFDIESLPAIFPQACRIEFLLYFKILTENKEEKFIGIQRKEVISLAKLTYSKALAYLKNSMFDFKEEQSPETVQSWLPLCDVLKNGAILSKKEIIPEIDIGMIQFKRKLGKLFSEMNERPPNASKLLTLVISYSNTNEYAENIDLLLEELYIIYHKSKESDYYKRNLQLIELLDDTKGFFGSLQVEEILDVLKILCARIELCIARNDISAEMHESRIHTTIFMLHFVTSLVKDLPGDNNLISKVIIALHSASQDISVYTFLKILDFQLYLLRSRGIRLRGSDLDNMLRIIVEVLISMTVLHDSEQDLESKIFFDMFSMITENLFLMLRFRRKLLINYIPSVIFVISILFKFFLGKGESTAKAYPFGKTPLPSNLSNKLLGVLEVIEARNSPEGTHKDTNIFSKHVIYLLANIIKMFKSRVTLDKKHRKHIHSAIFVLLNMTTTYGKNVILSVLNSNNGEAQIFKNLVEEWEASKYKGQF